MTHTFHFTRIIRSAITHNVLRGSNAWSNEAFGWSAGGVAVAVQVPYRVGLALLEAHGAKAQVKENMACLEPLDDTLHNVNKVVSNCLPSTSLQGNADAI